ncbi:NAD-dependent epimerase/dehydratase family protein [Weissella paramesenteroides]|uniref:NAD-dependent epimerase/dehydratase family protein n=1 Tax=Weissella paramesenteroides TaxID=1249 RepID=UPI0023F75A96|nr:NAD-dependent epimerase/dehydratase family protein [Weissella paramesenteroides]
MKITIMGGTGYIGQGILSVLLQNKSQYELISLSRSGAKNHSNLVESVTYLRLI